MRFLKATGIVGRIPFIFILVFIAGYFWLFGDSIFPDWNYSGISYSTTVSYYIVLLATFLIFSRLRQASYLTTQSNIALKQFLLGFLLTLICMLLLVASGIIGQNTILVGLVLPMVIMQVFIVAPAEELMFRGVLQSYIGIIPQALLFAGWHTVTYGYVWSNLGWPPMNIMFALFVSFAFGIIMGLVAIRKDLGIPACIGAHACYNLVVLGVITL